MPLSPPQTYRKTKNTHRRGLASARPTATDVLEGTLYFSSDDGIIERSTGSIWESYSLPLLTEGSVIFAGTGGNKLAQDNTNLFWDDTVKIFSARNINVRTSGILQFKNAAETLVGQIFGSGSQFFIDGENSSPIKLRYNDIQIVKIGPDSGESIVSILDTSTMGGENALAIGGTRTASIDHGRSFYCKEAITLGAGLAGIAFQLDNDYVTAASGTHADIAGMFINQMTITNTGAAVTNLSSLYIQNAPTGVTPTNGPYSLFVDAGVSRFDDNILLGATILPSTGTSGLIFGDGTSLSGMGANTAGLYADDVGGIVMMFQIDEAGNITRLNHVNRALGGGAAATLGTIGGSGPTVAAQNSWMEYSVAGTTYWIPVWI